MNCYKLKPGNGDEISINEMTDEELFEERDFWNRTLHDLFFRESATYDHAARMVRELEEEMARRDEENRMRVEQDVRLRHVTQA